MQVLPLLSSSSSNHWTIRLIELILDQKGITFYGFVVRNNGTFLFDFLAGGVKQRFGGWGRGRKEEDREKERKRERENISRNPTIVQRRVKLFGVVGVEKRDATTALACFYVGREFRKRRRTSVKRIAAQ